MTAVGELLTENIGAWTEAVKPKSSTGRGGGSGIELYGVKKLRELILNLAVRGLLVPQNPHDEPASVLKQMSVNCASFVAQGTIKEPKPLLELLPQDHPFNLPSGWVWCRLGELGNTQTGGTPKKADSHHYGTAVPFVKPGDIVAGEIVSYEKNGLTEEGASCLDRVAPHDSVLMVCIGSMVNAPSSRPVAFNQQINSVSPYCEIGSFLHIALQADFFQQGR